MKKKIAVIALAIAASIASLNAQTLTTAVTNAFPPFSTSISNYIPSVSSFALHMDVRAGYGFNLNSRERMEALTASVSISPSLSFGGVVSRDRLGVCAGGVTLGINGSVNVPLVGELDCFAGEGVAYDFHYKAPANYLFTGVERPFTVGKFRIAPGLSLANTSTRAGTVLFGGVAMSF